MSSDRSAAAAQRAMAAAQRAQEVEARLALLGAGRPTSEHDLVRARAAAARSARWALEAEEWYTTVHARTADENARSNGSSVSAAGDLTRRVVEAVGRLARLQVTDHDDPFTDAAQVCAQALGSGCGASLTVGPPQQPERLACHGTLAESGGEAQRRAREGPTADAWSRQVVVAATRLATDPRWPEFTRLMRPGQVTSVVAVPVLMNGRTIAVVTGYTTDPPDFSHLDVPALECLARGVAMVLQTKECARLSEQVRQLQDALTSRAVIDQAIGILMAHGHCDADQAFERLRSASRNRNIKLREIARMLVDHTQNHAASPR